MVCLNSLLYYSKLFDSWGFSTIVSGSDRANTERAGLPGAVEKDTPRADGEGVLGAYSD